MAYALEILPPTGEEPPAKRLLGLSTALRLALTAQAAGAAAIVAADPRIRTLLADARLTIPVVDARPSGTFVFRVPANLVVHRGLFAAARAKHGDRDWDVVEDPFTFEPPYGFQPILVVDKATRGAATRALLRSLRKPQDGWTSTYLNRHVSLFFTRFLVATPLGPNQVSVGILGIGLAGAWLALHGTYLTLLAGAFLFQMQSILDGCDGEMSRLTFRGSKLGEWLDTIGDDITNYGFFTASAWGIHRATGNPLYLVCGGVVLACGLLVSAIEYRYLIKIGSGDLLKYPLGVGSAPGCEGEPSAFDKYIAPLFKRDSFVFLTLVGAALGVLPVMLFAFAIGGVSILAAVLRAEMRMYRERRAGLHAGRVVGRGGSLAGRVAGRRCAGRELRRRPDILSMQCQRCAGRSCRRGWMSRFTAGGGSSSSLVGGG